MHPLDDPGCELTIDDFDKKVDIRDRQLDPEGPLGPIQQHAHGHARNPFDIRHLRQDARGHVALGCLPQLLLGGAIEPEVLLLLFVGPLHAEGVVGRVPQSDEPLDDIRPRQGAISYRELLLDQEARDLLIALAQLEVGEAFNDLHGQQHRGLQVPRGDHRAILDANRHRGATVDDRGSRHLRGAFEQLHGDQCNLEARKTHEA